MTDYRKFQHWALAEEFLRALDAEARDEDSDLDEIEDEILRRQHRPAPAGLPSIEDEASIQVFVDCYRRLYEDGLPRARRSIRIGGVS